MDKMLGKIVVMNNDKSQQIVSKYYMDKRGDTYIYFEKYSKDGYDNDVIDNPMTIYNNIDLFRMTRDWIEDFYKEDDNDIDRNGWDWLFSKNALILFEMSL